MALAVLYAVGFGVFLWLLPASRMAPPMVDGLAVFTGGSNRVVTGLELIKDGFAGPVLISGVQPEVGLRTLTHLVHLTPQQEQQITLDTLAATTRANVINTLMWADAHNVRTIGVVTSTYHALRCEALFWWYGALGRVRLMPVQPVTGGLKVLLREYSKLLVWPLLA